MSVLDNNKKKRDQKGSETEKEIALAHLQDLFLGAKAPDFDFLPAISISPALLPKEEKKVQLQTCEKKQNFGDYAIHCVPSNIQVKATKKTEETKKTESNPLIEPIIESKPKAESKPDLELKLEPKSDSELKKTDVKPLTSFDFLAVGVKPASSSQPEETPSKKSKSFLAHFAKKDSSDKKD